MLSVTQAMYVRARAGCERDVQFTLKQSREEDVLVSAHDATQCLELSAEPATILIHAQTPRVRGEGL